MTGPESVSLTAEEVAVFEQPFWKKYKINELKTAALDDNQMILENEGGATKGICGILMLVLGVWLAFRLSLASSGVVEAEEGVHVTGKAVFGIGFCVVTGILLMYAAYKETKIVFDWTARRIKVVELFGIKRFTIRLEGDFQIVVHGFLQDVRLRIQQADGKEIHRFKVSGEAKDPQSERVLRLGIMCAQRFACPLTVDSSSFGDERYKGLSSTMEALSKLASPQQEDDADPGQSK